MPFLTSIEAEVVDVDDITIVGRDLKKCSAIVQDSDGREELLIDFLGDQNTRMASRLEVGNIYLFEVQLRSREYNGRYYTNVLCNYFQEVKSEQEPVEHINPEREVPPAKPAKSTGYVKTDEDDDVPF